MNAEQSERLFSSYLDNHNMKYERDFRVCGEKNVDFKINTTPIVLCDVKEVRDSKKKLKGVSDAYNHIKNDINKLRKKFGSEKPAVPVVLVTMNFSKNFFTALSVAQALGDIGCEFQGDSRSEIRHLPRGNAALTRNDNTLISGVLVYDYECGNHRYFLNPFAKYQIPSGYFPNVTEHILTRDADESELVNLTRFMYWSYKDSSKN